MYLEDLSQFFSEILTFYKNGKENRRKEASNKEAGEHVRFKENSRHLKRRLRGKQSLSG